jgi:hypothetical protein
LAGPIHPRDGTGRWNRNASVFQSDRILVRCPASRFAVAIFSLPAKIPEKQALNFHLFAIDIEGRDFFAGRTKARFAFCDGPPHGESDRPHINVGFKALTLTMTRVVLPKTATVSAPPRGFLDIFVVLQCSKRAGPNSPIATRRAARPETRGVRRLGLFSPK